MSAKLTPSILQAGFGLLLLFSNLPALEVEKIYNEALIRNYAQQYGVDEELALAIAQAESQLITLARNRLSSASGLFQFLDGTAQTYCVDKYQIMASLKEKDDPDKQIKCAMLILSEPKGYQHWEMSRYGKNGWGHLLN